MNAAVFGCAFDFFAKYKWINTYDPMLATPIGTRDILWGELAWVLLRVAVSAVAFAATIYPALQASRLEPVEAIRHD